MVLPNLLVIGAMKAGTTSFHEMLNQHPEIFMSDVKEINFFSDDLLWEKGLDWYQLHFREASQFKVRGESSVNYSKKHRFKNVPERINEVLKRDLKLIYILRDPVDRFRSNFTDSKTYGDIWPEMSINDFVRNQDINKNPLAHTGKYYDQISAFLEFIGPEKIMLIEFERLVRDTTNTMNEVCAFLGLKRWSFTLQSKNRSERKRHDSAFLIKLRRIKYVLPPKWRNYIVNNELVQNILKTPVDNPLNKPDRFTNELLRDYYKGDIGMLQKSFKFYPKYWRKYN